MGRAVLHSFAGVLAVEQGIDHPGGEPVADPVVDLQSFARRDLVKCTVGVEDGRPSR